MPKVHIRYRPANLRVKKYGHYLHITDISNSSKFPTFLAFLYHIYEKDIPFL
jgi:hypothetical protein